MANVNNITAKELKARLDAGEDIDIVDVREDWEVARGMIDGAIHIPMNDVPDELEQISKDKPVVIMCHMGGRSENVVLWLQQQGYENLLNLDGGIHAWSKDVDPSIPG